MKIPLKNLSDQQLGEWLEARGQQAFRARQITEWLYRKWALSFAEMTPLPLPLREELDSFFTACSLREIDRMEADDGTVKFLHELLDGETIEAVFIPSPERRTVCISTQVGCPVRCSFCASGRGGLVRNLTRAEIIDQVIHACRQGGAPVTNVVVMGMGEPLLNLEELIPALERLRSEDHLALSARHITVSTSGIPDGIRALADQRRPWNLALSLHATTDEKRAELIPPAHRAPIAEILEACHYYRSRTNRMVTLEYALIAGSNDGENACRQLAGIARNLRAKVNLIPCNPASGQHLPPGGEKVQRFLQSLLRHGVQATLRQRRGDQIQAACGQLRQRTIPATGARSPGLTDR